MSSAPTDGGRAARAVPRPGAGAGARGGGGCAPPARAEGADRPVFFRDPDPATARAIDRAIGRFGDPSPNNRETGRDELFDIGYWTVNPLHGVVEEKGSQFRCNSLLVLGRLADPRSSGLLRAVAGEEKTEWPPVFAALMLGRMRDASDAAMAVYGRALDVPQNDKRRAAVALSLGKIHRRRAVEGGDLLERILDAPTPNPAVHYAALLALGFYRSRVAEPSADGASWVPSRRIADALGDSREGMRYSAVLALALSRLDGFETIYRRAFEDDGDKRVRLAALLALGKPREAADDSVTDLLTSVLESPRVTGQERTMAAYLLALRKDPRSVDALLRTANSPRSADVSAAAVVALGGIADPRVADLLVSRMSHPSPTVRAAAAVASVELVETADLKRLREILMRRLEQGETSEEAKFDMTAALDEIGKILRDREDARNGLPVKRRPPPEWFQEDSMDLFLRLGRTHREAVLDAANLRVLEVLGIDSLFPYRPTVDGAPPAGEGGLGSATRFRREHSVYLEQYDLRNDFDRRPFYTPEDYPDEGGPAAPVPRDGR